MSYQFIINNEQLAAFCLQIANSPAIALDTEFVRTRTFYPHLGLIQVFDGHVAALIDPLAITNWQDFIAILINPKIEKYLHSCSEDIEVFQHQFNCIPTPIIDSQILASFLDNPLSSGYASLVKKYLNVDLDKSETRTDWLNRPLTEKQCEYAINDVLYLLPLIEKLKALLITTNWLEAAYQECQLLTGRKAIITNPEDAYLTIKNNWQLKGKNLGALKKLAHWRYDIAKTQNIALNFVIHEKVLWKIANYFPTSLAELEKLGMKGKEIRLYGQKVLAMLTEPLPAVPAIKRVNTYPNYKQISEQLKQATQTIAMQTGLNPDLLLSRKLINNYVKWQAEHKGKEPEIISGWRKPLFAKFVL